VKAVACCSRGNRLRPGLGHAPTLCGCSVLLNAHAYSSDSTKPRRTSARAQTPLPSGSLRWSRRRGQSTCGRVSAASKKASAGCCLHRFLVLARSAGDDATVRSVLDRTVPRGPMTLTRGVPSLGQIRPLHILLLHYSRDKAQRQWPPRVFVHAPANSIYKSKAHRTLCEALLFQKFPRTYKESICHGNRQDPRKSQLLPGCLWAR
jgi:hypothetical protein